MLVYAWMVPYLDHRDVWVVDGDAARWLGVAVLAVGGVLRVWPMFVLGRFFSGLVAIQPHHELVTHGPYRFVRHPSYLGMLLGFAGWALVFRSALGLAVVPFAVWFVLQRIAAEEHWLISHFGAAYEEYRSRTACLVPGLY
jgi:protein-S-isoprenylcysteine O-methyltransferase Ste14